MGTNYYLETDVCPHCGTSKGRLHIGKSSAGWCFSLHVDSDEGVHDLDDWRARWSMPNSRIVDEYGRVVSVEAMERTITGRSWARPPSHLIRREIGDGCIGHGAGPWDLIVGEFS